MTTLTELKKGIFTFGNIKKEKMEEYAKKKTDLFKKVADKQMYQSEAEQRLVDYSELANKTLKSQSDQLRQALEQFKESELSKIKESTEAVTSDIVAELQLLETTKVTAQEMQDYALKYQNNPLALKKVHEIANNNDILLPTTATNADNLEEATRVLGNYLKEFESYEDIRNSHSINDLDFTLTLADETMSEAVELYGGTIN